MKSLSKIWEVNKENVCVGKQRAFKSDLLDCCHGRNLFHEDNLLVYNYGTALVNKM